MDAKQKTIQVAKGWRSLEAMLELICQLIGITAVYIIFEQIGFWLIGENFQKDTLLSMVVLPAIYILKDAYKIIEPFYVSIILINQHKVQVKRGILTQEVDNLVLENIENIELTKTPLGRIFGYTTFSIYSDGSWIELPFVRPECEHRLCQTLFNKDNSATEQVTAQ